MDKITDEVYTYMLDDIQREILRARNKFNSIVKHLEEHPTTARFKAETARNTVAKLKEVLGEIDELPVLPVEYKDGRNA